MDFKKELVKELGFGAIAEETMLNDYVEACEAIAVRYHDHKVKTLGLFSVMPRISYAEDWEGNKYDPCEINCKLGDDGKIRFETKEVFGLGDVPLDLEPEYWA